MPGSLKPPSNGTSNGSNNSTGPKPVPLGPKPDFLDKPKPAPTRNGVITGSDHQKGPDINHDVTATLTKDLKEVPPRIRAKSLGAQDQRVFNKMPEGETTTSKADDGDSLPIWSHRNRLSMEQTSRFESPSQLEKEVDSARRDNEKARPPNSPSAESKLKSTKLLVETGEMEGKEVSGSSIKRRISLLFDRPTASQHRDSYIKKDTTPSEISVDIRQRIKNLSLNSAEPKIRLPSTGALKRTSSNSDEYSFDERAHEKPAESELVQNGSHQPKGQQAAEIIEIKPDVKEKAKEAPTPKFGFEKNVLVEDKNSINKVEDEVEEGKKNYVPVPLYRRVGTDKEAESKREEEERQKKEEQLETEIKQQEKERVLEEERKARQEIERLQEEKQKRAEEERCLQEERRKIEEERERDRQKEKERLRLEKEREKEEEKKRIEEERLRQDREKERLRKEKDMEERRRIEEEERLIQEREKERLRKEREMEEERRRIQEFERQKEEERLRQEREKERLRKEKEMEERKQVEEEERLRQDREKERLRKEKDKEERRRIEEEERLIQEREKERLKKEKEIEEERRQIQEMERLKEEERLRQEREKERLRKEKDMEERRRIEEEERLIQERAKERLKKEKEIEEERRQIQEMERLKEEERLRQEREKERLRKEREMEEERRQIQEMERLKEEERLRQEREKERLRKEREMEEERRQIQEMERLKEEERLRQEREKERLRKEREMEEERRQIQEMERLKEEERLRQERENERLRKEREKEERKQMKEEERLRQEREKERLKKEKEIEEERKQIQEMERQKEEERLRQEREKERLKNERQMEEKRRQIEAIERHKEEERLRQEREKERLRKEREMEEKRSQIEEIERHKEEESLRQTREIERLRKGREMKEERRHNKEMERLKDEERLRQERENERLKEEREMEQFKEVERLREEVPTSSNLISFDLEEPALLSRVSNVQATNILPQIPEVLFDDFSVKPRRWGTKARRSSTPSPSREPTAVDVIPEELDQKPESQSKDPGFQRLDQALMDDLIGFEPAPSNLQISSSKHPESRNQLQTVESKPEHWSKPETKSSAPWRDEVTSHEGELKDSVLEDVGVPLQDTDFVIKESDSPDTSNIIVDNVDGKSRIFQALHRVKQPNVPTDSDNTNAPGQEEPELLPFPESLAPLLDSSVFRSKVDLAKKRSIKRTRPSRSVRHKAVLPSLTEGTYPNWRFFDSTEAAAQCSNGGDSDSEEEPSKDSTYSPAPSQPKRVPLFPGMDQSALMAQLKRRSGAVEADTPSEGLTTPSVPTRSPRVPTKSLGPRVLPPVDAKDSGSGSSPSWLLQLKSKKRTSQPESEV
ncbi:trichohyalin-like [Xyrauchen texanus]|uniref:trichohyalin-like n=1 Tax=Xyrauchen texanus TaxID=154827 RepID=UPI00224233CC|nr:trichohyalin-like [Xyrauchen texanus]